MGLSPSTLRQALNPLPPRGEEQHPPGPLGSRPVSSTGQALRGNDDCVASGLWVPPRGGARRRLSEVSREVTLTLRQAQGRLPNLSRQGERRSTHPAPWVPAPYRVRGRLSAGTTIVQPRASGFRPAAAHGAGPGGQPPSQSSPWGGGEGGATGKKGRVTLTPLAGSRRCHGRSPSPQSSPVKGEEGDEPPPRKGSRGKRGSLGARDTLNNPSARLNFLCVELQSTNLFRPSLDQVRAVYYLAGLVYVGDVGEGADVGGGVAVDDEEVG